MLAGISHQQNRTSPTPSALCTLNIIWGVCFALLTDAKVLQECSHFVLQACSLLLDSVAWWLPLVPSDHDIFRSSAAAVSRTLLAGSRTQASRQLGMLALSQQANISTSGGAVTAAHGPAAGEGGSTTNASQQPETDTDTLGRTFHTPAAAVAAAVRALAALQLGGPGVGMCYACHWLWVCMMADATRTIFSCD